MRRKANDKAMRAVAATAVARKLYNGEILALQNSLDDSMHLVWAGEIGIFYDAALKPPPFSLGPHTHTLPAPARPMEILHGGLESDSREKFEDVREFSKQSTGATHELSRQDEVSADLKKEIETKVTGVSADLKKESETKGKTEAQYNIGKKGAVMVGLLKEEVRLVHLHAHAHTIQEIVGRKGQRQAQSCISLRHLQSRIHTASEALG